jgi:Domain of unknown function (DUF4406)
MLVTQRWYVAGPMRGYPAFNFASFDSARDLLRELGHEVISPADHDRSVYPDIEQWSGYPDGDIDACPAFDYHQAIGWDLHQITAAETTGVALLPGWERSTGARLERDTCLAVGKQVRYVDPDKRMFGTVPHRLIVGLTGYAGSGKDTAAEGLVAMGWARVAFADPLKEIARAVGWDGRKDDPGRRLLQVLGVEVRRKVAEDAWVQAAARAIDAGDGDVVITDVRFANEAAWVRSRGGIVVRITRPGVGPANQHESELLVDEIVPDAVLVNEQDQQDRLHTQLAAVAAV